MALGPLTCQPDASGNHKCKARKPRPCEECGNLKAEHIPDPYKSDLNGDNTLHWLCDNCAEASAYEL